MENDIYFNENPSLCYQCGKCSSGCPMAGQMDILPHQIIHLLAIGKENETLDKKTPWLCAACYTCAVRCPNDIDITAVMDYVRQKAIQNNVPCPVPEIFTFHKNFIKNLSRRGRVHELRMMTEYNIKTRKPFKNAGLAPKMIAQKKLKIKPPQKIKGFKKWLKGVGITGRKTNDDNR